MRFRVLGSLLVRNGTGWHEVPAEQQRVVLAVLLSAGGSTVSTERLVDEVWPDRPPRRAVNTVQAYVLRLRRLLGDDEHRLIITRGHGYELVLGQDELDATMFETLASSGRRALDAGQPAQAVNRLSGALGLWRGAMFADVPETPALTGRIARLERTRLAAQDDLLVASLRLGRHEAVADELFRLVEETPLREQRWALLMRALAGCGRRAEALDAFRRASQVLRTELDVAPGRRLCELRREILAEGPQGQPVAAIQRRGGALVGGDLLGGDPERRRPRPVR